MNSKATISASSVPELESRLLNQIVQLRSVAVAFSGGVDSSVLLHAAHRALGERAVAVIADSPSLPRHEFAEAQELATSMGVRLRVVRTDEMDNANYVANRGDRCFFCKWALFDAMQIVAEEEQLEVLAFGEITDDLNDDRPGARAAKQRGVVAPLREAGFSKVDVRAYAERYGLSVASKPASACLASRIPVGTAVSREGLALVEQAERTIAELGLRVLRVRNHAPKARVEVGADEFDAAILQTSEIEARLGRLGFDEVELAKYGE